MKEIVFIVTDKEGFHARPACSLMMAVRDFSCTAWIETENQKADMHNLMELMALGVKTGERMVFRFSGQQENEAWESTMEFLERWK